MGFSVFVPPPHTMLADTNTGSWFDATPEHCQVDFAIYDAALRQALSQSCVGISDTDYKEVLYESSGYQTPSTHVSLTPQLIFLFHIKRVPSRSWLMLRVGDTSFIFPIFGEYSIATATSPRLSSQTSTPSLTPR
jgi:hypothetical protein